MVDGLGVVIPVYNNEKNNRFGYFLDCIESIAAQDIGFRCLIVDNGSTDEDTLDFYESLLDPRFSVHKIGRLGPEITPARSLNYGFKQLYEDGADAFCYLHSDDLLTENSLEKRVDELKNENNMAYSRMAYFNGSLIIGGYPRKEQNTCSSEVMIGAFPHHTSMWGRNLMGLMLNNKGRDGEIFGYDVSCCEDFDATLFSRRIIEENNFSLGFVDECLYIWVNHDGNITNAVTSREHENVVEYIYRKNGYKNPEGSFLEKIIRRPGFWLSEDTKKKLRPLKGRINKLTFGFMFPYGYVAPQISQDIDPYWFKKKEYLERK